MKYIYHHMGLGDHVICNGLVRKVIKPNEEYILFVKEHNLSTVKFMYRDLENLKFIVGDDTFVNNFLSLSENSSTETIYAGFQIHPDSKNFDESFYLQNNIPFSNRWSSFKVIRDIDAEINLFKHFNVKENEYVFIHDDSSRGFEINEDLIINKDLPKIRPRHGLTNNVFDYCYLMEKSIESHFIDSSFRLIFDSLKLRNTNIFYHLKLKNGNYRNGTKNSWSDARNSILNFEIIE